MVVSLGYTSFCISVVVNATVIRTKRILGVRCHASLKFSCVALQFSVNKHGIVQKIAGEVKTGMAPVHSILHRVNFIVLLGDAQGLYAEVDEAEEAARTVLAQAEKDPSPNLEFIAAAKAALAKVLALSVCTEPMIERSSHRYIQSASRLHAKLCSTFLALSTCS